MIRFQGIGAALLPIVAGCGLTGSVSGDRLNYFPMEANRVWEYRLHDIAHDDEWPMAVRSRGPRFVPELGRVVAIFDEQYPDEIVPVAFFLAEGFLHSDIGLGYGEKRRMGVYPIGTQPMRLLPVPPRLGIRWDYKEEIFGSAAEVPATFAIHWSGDVQAIESIEVPAGEFRDCLRVLSIAVHSLESHRNAVQHRYVDWYAPGVGLVKSEYSFGDEKRTITRLELVRHYRSSGDAPGTHPHFQIASASRANFPWSRATTRP